MRFFGCRPPCSDIVIELLREKEQLRRSEIVEAAKAKVGCWLSCASALAERRFSLSS